MALGAFAVVFALVSVSANKCIQFLKIKGARNHTRASAAGFE